MDAQVFRLFFESLNENSSDLVLDKNQSHWLKRVLRKKDGDVFTALNGTGGVAQVKLCKDKCEVIAFKQELKKICTIEFYIAMLSLDKAKLIVEKLTEIGVSSIYFVKSKRSHKILDKKKHHEKLHVKAIESIKQCGNPYLPNIYFQDNLLSLLKNSQKAEKKVFLNENETKNSMFLPKLNSRQRVIISVGPEASWDVSEKELFLQHDFESVSLGPNVLRAETAAIVAAAQALTFCDFG
ncbi:RsmE family RNA methyltransferase [bacterium]|nr:RsmE family RNA methyltransferase [bacterium]